ncbi:MAG: bifunctional anthranilate synthase component I family protein/aminotransferase class IV, partial [Leptospiraceae bacterium]|nr:bifunctional anthranilate synthase component I family protein/aminotransferase class IV [Leptospiraceae bacterium]
LDSNELSEDYKISKIYLGLNLDDYKKKFEIIKNHILRGEIYQLNFSFPIHFHFRGNPMSLYLELKKTQKTSYSSIYKNGDYYILSLSPESFFKIENGIIQSRPMKGTGNENPIEITEKLKAENFMILDLLRNDFGKICKFGSVNVKDLLREENYGTLRQLTSGVVGELKNNSIKDIILSLFPSGSITGAPKLSAMKYISELESENRGIYTGSIGYVSPEGKSVFNILIRTIEINKNSGKINIGSGIVWDSKATEEYDECLLKSKFFFKNSKIDLLETILYKRNSFYYLTDHIIRLKNASNFFGYNIDFENIKIKISKNLPDNNFNYKIRLTCNSDKFNLEYFPLEKKIKYGKVQLSKVNTNSKNILLTYKNTNREIYNSEFQKAIEKGLTDFIFLNEKKEITEGSISNIFVLIGNIYYTPPVECGLLPGIFRNKLLKKFPKYFKIGIIREEDLKETNSIFICNSIRGIIRVNYEKTN